MGLDSSSSEEEDEEPVRPVSPATASSATATTAWAHSEPSHSLGNGATCWCCISRRKKQVTDASTQTSFLDYGDSSIYDEAVGHANETDQEGGGQGSTESESEHFSCPLEGCTSDRQGRAREAHRSSTACAPEAASGGSSSGTSHAAQRESARHGDSRKSEASSDAGPEGAYAARRGALQGSVKRVQWASMSDSDGSESD